MLQKLTDDTTWKREGSRRGSGAPRNRPSCGRDVSQLIMNAHSCHQMKEFLQEPTGEKAAKGCTCRHAHGADSPHKHVQGEEGRGRHLLQTVSRRAHERQAAEERRRADPGVVLPCEMQVRLESVDGGGRDGRLVETGEGCADEQLSLFGQLSIIPVMLRFSTAKDLRWE